MWPAPDITVGTTCNTQVHIGSAVDPNSQINGAFNKFVNCIFFRDTLANYGPTTSQPVFVHGRNNTFTDVRIGPETEGNPGGLTASSLDFTGVALPLNGFVQNCLTVNPTVNPGVLNTNVTFTY
jgi:hypothetical protein